ncbi:MAG: hypothetical protein HQK54_14810 [Oligoflexales bacterium]|nr:hypothetical protein [Oligoflexales bacterium]
MPPPGAGSQGGMPPMPPGGANGFQGGPGGNFPGGGPGFPGGPGGPGGARGMMMRVDTTALTNINGIIIRGSAPEDSLYLVDDIEVPYVFHNLADLSVLPGSMIQGVDYEAGGFGVEHGNASGGILRLLTKSDIPEHSVTELTMNYPFYSGVYNRTPVGQEGALSTSLRTSYVDSLSKGYYQSMQQKNKTEIRETPYFKDAHVAYTSKLSDGYRKVTLIAGEDGTKVELPNNFQNSTDVPMTTSITSRFGVLGVEQSSTINKSWLARTTPQVSYTNMGNKITNSDTSLEQTKIRVPTEFTRILSQNENLYLGVDPQNVNVKQTSSTLDFASSTYTDLADKVNYQNLGAWTAVEQKYGPVKLTPGVRAFNNGQIKKTSLDPRLITTTAVGPSNDIKATVGQYSTSPSFIEAHNERGNPNLNFERTYHYVLGLETRWSEAWSTEVQGFYKQGFSIVTPDPIDRYSNNGENRTDGFELFLRRSLTSRYFGWISYTYSKTVERDSKDQPFLRSAYDQTHVGNIVSGYKLTKTWDVAGAYRYSTGNTYTPSLGSTYDAANDRYVAIENPENENSANMPPVQSVSAYVTKEVLFDTWKMSVRLGVDSWWMEPQTDSMTASYDYMTDQPRKSFSTVPFVELKGVL